MRWRRYHCEGKPQYEFERHEGDVGRANGLVMLAAWRPAAQLFAVLVRPRRQAGRSVFGAASPGRPTVEQKRNKEGVLTLLAPSAQLFCAA